MKKIAFFLTTIFSLTAFSAEAEPNPCVSRHILNMKLSTGETLDVLVSGTGDQLVYPLDGHTSLVLERATNGAKLISRNQPNEVLSRPLTTREQMIASELKALGSGSYSNLIERCHSIPEPDRRPPLSRPLKSNEIAECKALAEQLREIKTCTSPPSCEKMYAKYYDQGQRRRPRDFSFRKQIETGDGFISPKMVALGTASAAGYAWDFTVVRAILKNKKALALRFTRAGVMVGGAAATAVSFTFLPITAYVFGHDTCNARAKDAINYDDCLGRTAMQLTPLFQRQIEQAIHSPGEFNKAIENPEAAVESRLSCMMIEDIVESFDQLNRRMTCQGLTLDTYDGKSYLVHADGHLSRQDDGFYKHHFDVENDKHEVEKLVQGIPDYRIPSRIENEFETLKMLAPRIREVRKLCQKPPAPSPNTPAVPNPVPGRN